MESAPAPHWLGGLGQGTLFTLRASVLRACRTDYSREPREGGGNGGAPVVHGASTEAKGQISVPVTAAGAAAQQVVDQATEAGQKGLLGLGGGVRAGGQEGGQAQHTLSSAAPLPTHTASWEGARPG